MYICIHIYIYICVHVIYNLNIHICIVLQGMFFSVDMHVDIP